VESIYQAWGRFSGARFFEVPAYRTSTRSACRSQRDIFQELLWFLAELGYENIHVKTGNCYQGWAEHATFDAIVVTAAPNHVPPALVEQLARQGKLVIPVGAGDQQMLVITKTAAGIVEQ
jgi:protein-L-isoaspartate O-methyltransferase